MNPPTYEVWKCSNVSDYNKLVGIRDTHKKAMFLAKKNMDFNEQQEFCIYVYKVTGQISDLNMDLIMKY